MNYGDVVLIEHCSTDLNKTKRRPAVIVSSDTYNNTESDRILIPITGNTTRACAHDVLIADNEPVFADSGLMVSSAIRVGKILTAHTNLIKRKIGHLSSGKMTEICNIMKQVLNLN